MNKGRGKEDAKKRIKDFKEHPSKKKPEHYTHSAVTRKGTIEAVLCKLCDNAIKSLIPDERFQTKERRGNQTIITKMLVLAESSDYMEIEILFDDNSRHITHGCRTCINHLELDQLEAMYIGDMEQQLLEEEAGLGELDWTVWNDRNPISFRIIRENGTSIGIGG